MLQRVIAIYITAIVLVMICLLYLPNFVIYLFGCWQLGTWIGKVAEDRINK